MSKLWHAAYKGDVEEVRRFLSLEGNSGVNEAFSSSSSSFDHCCLWSYCRLEARGTPLYWAVRNNHENIVSLLLKAGARVDVLDDFQETPLHWACSLGLESIVKMLLRANMTENTKNMQIQTRNADNETALHRAVIQNHPSIVALLLDYCSSLYSNPLLREDGERKEEVKEGIKEEDVMGISYALLYAADYGHTDIVRLLLSYSCPSFHFNINITDQGGRTALYRATLHGYTDIAALLLAHHCNPSLTDFQDGSTALHIAAYYGRLAILQLLLNHCPSLPSPSSSSSSSSSSSFSAGVVDVNHLNQSNCSALFYACKQGHLDVVKLLLLKGAKTEASFSSSSLKACCAFMTAVRHRHTTVALLLIRHDADWSSLLHTSSDDDEEVDEEERVMKELLIEEGRKQQRWRQRRSLLLFLIARQQISSLIRSETDPSTADAAMEWTSSCNDAEAAYAMDEESSGRCREAVFSSPDLVRFITGFL